MAVRVNGARLARVMPMNLRERCDRLPVSIALVLYTVVAVRCAWISDDAYITFRTIENFLDGRGLTWNVGERVQAFTHPLWLLILAGASAVTGDLYLTTIVLGLVFSVGAVLIFAAVLATSPLAAAVGLIALLFSKAFVDYSTSGLENPLTHLLLAAFLAVWCRRRPTARSFLELASLGGLIVLNRLDLLLIVLPALAVRWWEQRGLRALGMILLGFAPLLAWEVLALLYYGAPLPNTAYAKLNTVLPGSLLVKQGMYYLADALTTDALTMIFVVAGILVPFVVGPRRNVPLALGVILYLAYLLRIGGDFMSGRFLTAPLLMGVTLVSVSPAARSLRAMLVTLALVLVIGLTAPRAPLLSGERYGLDSGFMGPHGIADERACYYQATGLLRFLRGAAVPEHQWTRAGQAARSAGDAVVVCGNIGFFGYAAGPGVHIVDEDALADPLLARIPFQPATEWRIGHFRREIPAGYLETLRSGRNVIADPRLARLYDDLVIITRGPLLDPERLRTIVRWNWRGASAR